MEQHKRDQDTECFLLTGKILKQSASTTTENSDDEEAIDIHPLDLITAVYLSADDFLRQVSDYFIVH